MPKIRNGCQSCRLRHLKCDGNDPCSRCVKSKIECIKAYTIRFRHKANPSVKARGVPRCEYDFAEDQTWIRPTNSLSFVDETAKVAYSYEHETIWNSNCTTVPSASDHGRHQRSQLCETSPAASGRVKSSRTPGGFPGSVPMSRTRNHYEASPMSVASVQSSSDASDLHTLRHRVGSTRSMSFGALSAIGSDLIDERCDQLGLEPYDPTFLNSELQDATDVHGPHRLVNNEFGLEELGSAQDGISYDIPDYSVTHNSVVGNVQDSLIEGSSKSTEFPGDVYSNESLWPLSFDEAYLMRYFIDEMARAFDLCDQDRHFARVVPQRAAVCPVLLSAVLATAAHHLSRTKKSQHFVPDQYHQRCLQDLIPMLGDEHAIMDENLLAATVILRYLEETEVSICGTGIQNHLLGTHIFIIAQHSAGPSGLRQAAYWVALRQEVYVAFVSQRQVAAVFKHSNVYLTCDPADDCTWANRMVAHLADVMQFCYGEGERSIRQYNSLCNHNRQWMLMKPPSFSPIFHKEPEGEDILPQIWLLGDHVVCALQHYHLARILLAAHNPGIPRLGPGHKRAMKVVDDDIRASVLAVCGIAEANPRCSPNWVTACLSVAMCGAKFTARREQEALARILTVTEEEHGWPTRQALDDLMQNWGWNEE